MSILFEDGGVSVQKYIEDSDSLEEKELLIIATQLSEVLRYLHGQRIIRRDVKSENILIDKNGTIKLTDLGDGRRMTRPVENLTVNVGTDRYRAPEVWSWEDANGRSRNDLQEYSLLADCYSFAMTLYYMMTKGHPEKPKFKGEESNEQDASVRQLRDLQEYIEKYPSIVEIIKMSDHINPKYRKSMEEIFVVTKQKSSQAEKMFSAGFI